MNGTTYKFLYSTNPGLNMYACGLLRDAGADLESPPIKVVGEMARLFMDKVFTSGCKI